MRHFKLHDFGANYITRPPTGSKVAELLLPHRVSWGKIYFLLFTHSFKLVYNYFFFNSVWYREGTHFVAKELKRLSFTCIRLDAKRRKWTATCHDCPTRLRDFRWDAYLALYSNSKKCLANCIGSCTE